MICVKIYSLRQGLGRGSRIVSLGPIRFSGEPERSVFPSVQCGLSPESVAWEMPPSWRVRSSSPDRPGALTPSSICSLEKGVVVLNTALWLHILLAIALMAVILLQSGRSAGLGTIGGGAESILGKKKKGLDPLLMKATIVAAVAFMATALALSILHG